MPTPNHYNHLIETLDTLDTSYMLKYKRLPFGDNISTGGLNTYKKVWRAIGDTVLPYDNDILYLRYTDALERHHNRFLQFWFNNREIPTDPLAIGQLLVLCNVGRRHFENFNSSSKKYIVKELVDTIKNDAKELNKVYALQLLSHNLPEIRKSPDLVKLINRAFRSSKTNIEHTGTVSGHEDFLMTALSKHIPATHAAWCIYQALSSTSLVAMDMKEWISMMQMANINLHANESVELPELGLEDFSF